MVAQTGVMGAVELMVTEDDTALALGSSDVPVLGTPRLVTLCEQAARSAVADQLAPGETTVSLRIELTHLAPTKVGSTVRVEATLERVEGRRLVFSVSASDACGLVAAGKITRVLVEHDRFLDNAR